MSKYKIIAIGGDGVGPEVMEATCMILKEGGFSLDIEKPLSGEAAVAVGKEAFSDEIMKMCEKADGVLFGATGNVSVKAIICFRWIFDNYINIRPIVYYPGARSPLKDPDGIDFVILRENTEGLYPGREGDLDAIAKAMPEYRDKWLGKKFEDYGPGKFAVRIVSHKGVNRFVDFCCKYAQKRKEQGYPGKFTCVTKSNVLKESCGLYQKRSEEMIKKLSELSYEHFYVDDVARRLVRYPKDFDVISVSNLFGDIISDLGAELVGGLGIAPSANVGGTTPCFEPVHGSAPSYAGKNVINPTAMILSAKMLLDHLGLSDESIALNNAVKAVYRKGDALTYDHGGNTSTEDLAKAILRELT